MLAVETLDRLVRLKPARHDDEGATCSTTVASATRKRKEDDVRGRTCDIETLGRGKVQKIVRKRKQEKKAKT
jgi:hypothetical protein